MINKLFFLMSVLLFAQLSAKELHRPEIKLLNGTLQKKGNVTVRLEYSCKLAGKILDDLRDEMLVELDKALDMLSKKQGKKEKNYDVYKEVLRVLSPVREFFDEIKTHAAILKPLVEESLEPLATKGRPLKTFFFMKFFENPERDVMEFIKVSILTKKDLELFCEELSIFGSDILDSCSDEVKKNHTKFISQLKDKAGSVEFLIEQKKPVKKQPTEKNKKN